MVFNYSKRYCKSSYRDYDGGRKILVSKIDNSSSIIFRSEDCERHEDVLISW